MSQASTPHGSMPMGRLVGGMLLFVLLGTPLVAYVWETANRLFAGDVDAGRLALTVPAALVLGGLLLLLARTIRGWEGEREARATATIS
jgi:hypothetical protein